MYGDWYDAVLYDGVRRLGKMGREDAGEGGEPASEKTRLQDMGDGGQEVAGDSFFRHAFELCMSSCELWLTIGKPGDPARRQRARGTKSR